jgi:hypothetical protein
LGATEPLAEHVVGDRPVTAGYSDPSTDAITSWLCSVASDVRRTMTTTVNTTAGITREIRIAHATP